MAARTVCNEKSKLYAFKPFHGSINIFILSETTKTLPFNILWKMTKPTKQQRIDMVTSPLAKTAIAILALTYSGVG